MYHLFFIWALALFLTKPRSLLVDKVAGTKSEKKGQRRHGEGS